MHDPVQLDSWYRQAAELRWLNSDHQRFYPFNPHVKCKDSDRTCVGGACGDDTSKIVCGLQNLRQVPESDCIIYSIGGNNWWQFEQDALKKTPCHIYTFDCTGPMERFDIPQDPRLHFHHVCLGHVYEPAPDQPCQKKGEDEKNGKCGETWTLQQIQNHFGHTTIDLLKMDIEGWEYQIFESWPLARDLDQYVLPMQVLVEIHFDTSFPELRALPATEKRAIPIWQWKRAPQIVRLYERLADMGYTSVERDDNSRCACCTELTLVRVECPSHMNFDR